jgi:hypothetical protein
MKKEYKKPTIHVEVLSLDTPVAGACAASYGLEFPEFSAQGWFDGDELCDFVLNDADADSVVQKVDNNGNTVCYHSHTRTVFQS